VKRRGWNGAAVEGRGEQTRKRMLNGSFDSQTLKGKRPQERSLNGGGPLRGSATGKPGERAWNSEGEVKFMKGVNQNQHLLAAGVARGNTARARLRS